MNIEILLATYNSEPFLEDLLISLYKQSVCDFRLRVRDDGSKDNTSEILHRWSLKFGDRMLVEAGTPPTGSAKGNFSKLMERSTGDWIMFCDHDDVWFPNKIQESIRMISSAENKYGRCTPIYGFTDAVPTDRSLNQVGNSFWSFKKNDPKVSTRLSNLLVCPPMLGCTSIINKPLLDLATPIPVNDVTGHDWWSILVACALGKVVWSAERTVYYRMHGANASRQEETNLWIYMRNKRKQEIVKRKMSLLKSQANAILKNLSDNLPESERKIVQEFVDLHNSNFLNRRLRLIRGRYLYPDWGRNVGMLIYC